MASCDPFRQNHKRFIAETLLDHYSDISEDNLFLSIGRVTSWGSTAANDVPPTSVDSVKDDTDFWRGMLAAKRINRSDVSMVIRRVDWTAGAVYQAYRDNIDLFDDASPADFYALVDEERVYLCIDNNYGEASLIPPTHTDSIVRRLSDGYRWKFLYSIPESKRKFLTKSRAGAVGYMPVEYIENPPNDDRTLQWNVQQSAVNGRIEFAYFDADAKAYWVSTPSCLPPSGSNLVLSTVPMGATTIQISSPALNTDKTLYTDMILSIDGGAGQGQRRVIKDFTPLGGATGGGSVANVVIDELALGLSGTQDPSKQSYFSIQPRVVVDGDGRARDNANNPAITTADFVVKFGGTASALTGACSSFTPRFINTIEVVDGGKDYTFANLDIPKGLTLVGDAPVQFTNIASLVHAVIPPPGGHGANPVKELGAASLMISKEYSQSEGNKVTTSNDFRQFGIIKNPLLRNKQLRIKFYEPGVTGSFTSGATAAQTGASVVGTVVEWNPGVGAVTGTSELLLTEIGGGGTFSAGGMVNGLKVFDVVPKTVAGSEGRHLLKLTLTPVSGAFASSGDDYKKRHFVHGVGNQTTNVPQSRSSGQIYTWSPAPGTNLYGFLCLENPKGNFSVGEIVTPSTPLFMGTNGLSGPGIVSAIDTELVNVPSTYDLTTKVSVVGQNFGSDTFLADARASFALGTTTGYGYIIDWSPLGTGGTSGTMHLSGVQGDIVAGQVISYSVPGPSGFASTISGTITSVDHLSELKYRSGDVLYIQNIKPIMRDIEQREEIKLVIEL